MSIKYTGIRTIFNVQVMDVVGPVAFKPMVCEDDASPLGVPGPRQAGVWVAQHLENILQMLVPLYINTQLQMLQSATYIYKCKRNCNANEP